MENHLNTPVSVCDFAVLEDTSPLATARLAIRDLSRTRAPPRRRRLGLRANRVQEPRDWDPKTRVAFRDTFDPYGAPLPSRRNLNDHPSWPSTLNETMRTPEEL